jgi:hypothetical protein
MCSNVGIPRIDARPRLVGKTHKRAPKGRNNVPARNGMEVSRRMGNTCNAVLLGHREGQEGGVICINGGRVCVAVRARESRFDAIPWSARARAHHPPLRLFRSAPLKSSSKKGQYFHSVWAKRCH